jgi:transcriptional regulator with XRE-family HTH domain
MIKPISRTYSQYSLTALELFGLLIREARIRKGLTTPDLALRAGISRALLSRIERGDPGCSIGVFFEVAAICGLPLFDQEQQELTTQLAIHREKVTLLPKKVRLSLREVKDDF